MGAKLVSKKVKKRRKGDWTDDSKQSYWGKKDNKWIEIDAETQKPAKKSEPKKRDRTKSTAKDPKDRAWMDKLLEKRWGGVPEI